MLSSKVMPYLLIDWQHLWWIHRLYSKLKVRVIILKILTKKTFLEISVKSLLCFLVKNCTVLAVMSRNQTERKLTVKNKPNYGINSLENTLRLTCLKEIPGCQKRGECSNSPSSQFYLFSYFPLTLFESEIHIQLTSISTLLLHKSLFSFHQIKQRTCTIYTGAHCPLEQTRVYRKNISPELL